MKYNDYVDYDNNHTESDGLKEYWRAIDKIELLSASEEQTLAKKIKEGDMEAKERFIEANLRLVRYVASKSGIKGAPMDELIQEGNLALIKAVESFDPDKGYRFSTYAIPWLKVAINKAIANDKSVIKKNGYAVDKTIKYNKCIDKLAQKLNHMPNKYEIAEELGISVDDVDKINLLMQGTVSLDTNINDEDTELSELIANPNIDVENEVISKLSTEEFQKRVGEKNLTKNEMLVVYYFFGLDGNEPKSQAEIGRIMNLSRMRIGQILSAARKKLDIDENGIKEDVADNGSKYKIDNKTSKVLKKIQPMMNNEDYEELKHVIINARCNDTFNSIGTMELIISLLGFGFIGNKTYAPIEIANILRFDYNSMKQVINGVLSKYSHIFSQCEKEKVLCKK